MAKMLHKYLLLHFALLVLIQLSNPYKVNKRYNTKSSEKIYTPRYYSPRYYPRTPTEISQPLTMHMCRYYTYSQLRSCRVSKRKELMRSLSKKYFCEYKDKWIEYRRGKRQTNRNKRAINQCGGAKTKKVILQAYEARRPNVLRELLHDPENHLYQTMFVENCVNRAPINGFHCRMHQIKFKAAVWSLDPTSTKIEVMDVLVDGYCALSQII